MYYLIEIANKGKRRMSQAITEQNHSFLFQDTQWISNQDFNKHVEIYLRYF